MSPRAREAAWTLLVWVGLVVLGYGVGRLLASVLL